MMATTTKVYKYHPYIDYYLNKIETRPDEFSRRMKLVPALVRRKLDNPDVYIDHEKIDKAVEIIERDFYKQMPWELFVIACVHCYYRSTDTVVFDEFLIIVGTGNGKNGFISGLIYYLTTPTHGVREYNVEIVANSEEQAKTSFTDVYDVLEDDWGRLKKYFYKTKEVIRNLRTRSMIKYNTSNAKTRLGKRAACLVFDEILEYLDWTVFNAFNASFGKKKHSRKFLIGTNGYTRQGFLDDWLELADGCLSGDIESLGILPLIYELDEREEVHDRKKWVKANPSKDYLPELARELETQYVRMQHQPSLALDYLTKRMNLPAEDSYTVVASKDKIQTCNRIIPFDEIEGLECIGAVDYAQINDFAAVGLLFKHGGNRIWYTHSFVCHLALKEESRKIKFPIQEMADRGLLTIVRDDIIKPTYIAEWFLVQADKYRFKTIVGDRYRVAILQDEFTKEGLPLESVAAGPITHAKVAPLVNIMFAEETLIWGVNPLMNWYTNNTYQDIDQKGNVTYKKVEPRLRKTDGFFALIHALSRDAEIKEVSEFIPIGTISF